MVFSDVVVATITESSVPGIISESLALGDVVVSTITENNEPGIITESLALGDVVVATTTESSVPGIISESLALGDVVVTIITESKKSSIITESLALGDVILTSLNDVNLVNLSETLSLNSTLFSTDYAIPTGGIVSDIQLEHDTIVINKPVIWTQDVTLTNNTKSIWSGPHKVRTLFA